MTEALIVISAALLQSRYCQLFLGPQLDRFIGAEEEAKRGI